MISRIQSTDKAEVFRLISSTSSVNLEAGERKILESFMGLSSHIWIGLVDKKLICFWGLNPPTLLSDCAYLWMYTTPALDEHMFVFVRQSQIAIEKMLAEYQLIGGHAAVGNSRAIRWLKWLGAEFGEPVGKLIPFYIRAKNG